MGGQLLGEKEAPHSTGGPTYHSISFKSLDIIHAKSNITMADCKKKRRLRSKAAVLKRRVHIGVGLHTWARPELSRVPAKPLKIEGLPSEGRKHGWILGQTEGRRQSNSSDLQGGPLLIHHSCGAHFVMQGRRSGYSIVLGLYTSHWCLGDTQGGTEGPMGWGPCPHALPGRLAALNTHTHTTRKAG